MSHVCFKGSTSRLVDSGGTKKLRKRLSSTNIQALTWVSNSFTAHIDTHFPCFSPQVQKAFATPADVERNFTLTSQSSAHFAW
ncbi:hypothetical protein ATANTOWER_023232 [Ataeniobius toweri]|uniref:Uncharacterized protein n=1 Tax=Ataeniobius toweri TaxID=208326 RepID=A0ABU7B2R7_9TELE|nr:hypothetical protein [Ataeniobius toweri]